MKLTTAHGALAGVFLLLALVTHGIFAWALAIISGLAWIGSLAKRDLK